jgi:HemY protein
MIRILVFLAVLVALAFFGAWLADQPGGIVLTLGGDTVEMSLWTGVVAVAAACIALMLAWWLIRTVLRLPQSIGFAARARRRAKGFAAISRGMIAVGAGDPRTAKRHADDAGKLLGNEPLALLLKAQAAQMAGDRGSAEGAFRQMLDEPETKVLGLRGLFVEARRKGDAAAARAYASEAARIAPSVSWAGEALLEYQCADEDWTGALATLDRAAKGMDKAEYRRRRAVLLTADGLSRAEKQADAALARAQEAVKLAPDLVPAATLAGRLLARRGDLRKAAKTLEAAWKVQPHPELATAYLAVRPGDSARDRMARADRLLAISQHHEEARIAAAGAAVDGRDFARARAVLAPLLNERPSVRVCLLMADIAHAEGLDDGAVREWLGRAARAPRDPAWIADGVISERWAPVSPVSGRLDAFAWGTPVERLSGPDALAPDNAYRPGDRARLGVPAHDAVLADVDEPRAAAIEVVAEPVPQVPAELPRPVAEPEVVARPAALPEVVAPEAPVPAAAPQPPSVEEARAVPAVQARAEPAAVIEEHAAAAQPGKATQDIAEPAIVPHSPGLHETAPGDGKTGDAKVHETRPDGEPVEKPREATALPLPAPRRPGAPTPVVFPMPVPPDDPGPEGFDGPGGNRSRFLQ